MRLFYFIIIVVTLLLYSCTEQYKVRNLGEVGVYDLPPGKKLIVVTWKEDNLWYLVRDRKEGESVDTFEFIETSSFGIWEGKMILREN